MSLVLLRVMAVVSVALYLVPTAAHLFELPGKLGMAPQDYMVVQRIYAGWALFGAVLVVAMLLVLLHGILRRQMRGVLLLSLIALACLAATLLVFWQFTYPVNVVSQNWTLQPEPFEAARRQWEFSHAASAVLTFLALLAITTAVALDAREASRSRTGLPSSRLPDGDRPGLASTPIAPVEQ